MNIEDRIERLNTFINEDRVIRRNWADTDEHGREEACLLVALSPEVAEYGDAGACPAGVMPAWLAYLTPWMADRGTGTEWPRMIRRYAACAARWSSLDDAAWRRVEIAVRRACVSEAMSHTADEKVLNSCHAVLAWLAEGMPEQSRKELRASLEEVVAAAATATAVAAVSEATAEEVVAATAAAATAAAATAAVTAEAVVTVVGAATVVAAWAVAAPEAVAWAVTAAAQGAAADRITDAILSALEAECG
jgi:hypothetical protein